MSSQTTNTPQGTALHHVLAAHSAKRSVWRWIFWLLVLLALAGLVFFMLRSEKQGATPLFTTEAVLRDTLVVTVSATGNLQPTNKVDVGSELSGIVDQVFVDVNDQVRTGQVLARLDLSKIMDSLAKSRANLEAATAQLAQSQATVAENKADLERLRTVQRLSAGKMPSVAEMLTAEANLKRAVAAEAVAKASISQARAVVQSDETDLRKASIYSPIDGVVLARSVEPGQTVAASFQAPVLFTLAEDLSKMELQVDVDEADVGQVQEGQNATFGVDAWPGRKYTATITRVSYGSQEKDNVISYLTILTVNNADLSLRPGMTGTAEITTLTQKNALLVPNAALRFSPPEHAASTAQKSRSLSLAFMPRPPRQPVAQQKKSDSSTPRVWIMREGQPVPVEVRTGATNGRMTEILTGDLQAGTEVITEMVDTAP